MAASVAFPYGPVARTTVGSQPQSLRPVQLWAAEFARCFGISGDELTRIELAVEEAFMSVAQSAFEPGESGEITLVLEHRPGSFVIAVEDHGLPLDLKQLEENEGLALNLLLLRHLLDGFSFINRGKEGKRLELIKQLPAESVATGMEQQDTPEQQAAVCPAEQPLLRLLRPDESLALAQLAYRSYGYTYVSDFYYPERIRERMAGGLMETCAAVLPDGRIIAALSLFYDRADACVAECGAAMVDPRYRGLSLFKEMKLFLFDHARCKGLYGIYSEAVTIHPYTQQGNLSLGARETGILLSYVSENVAFKKIGNELMGQRQALVYFYYRLNREPLRTVWLPALYAGLIRRVYAENGLNRQVEEVAATDRIAGGETRLAIRIRRDAFNDATIEPQRIGSDACVMILHHTRELCEKKVEAVYLDLSLGSPEAAALAGQLAEKGYLFAGIIPELENGDLLRLQYLNNVQFDPARVTVVSDTAKELLAFITRQYEQRP
ncbi:ATP-binding protein [Trichlorobacter ammonificans]|uniref:N-acetyltransferase domain-containing protein n=1 Tax=Trichlorobacter ammonificans TaxID=2916410 RepID=A0ABM9D6Z4_9BACT|nr:ATP-binding protein [Trichlorobacter ammonificans]CAH2030947.1 N-acetyltransferase domain-containing protein [Trichlorobacter ammonificans]